MSRWRLAARLARRDVRRRPGRTALVALLVALPVAGMVVAAVLVETGARTPAERWQASYGSADAVLHPSGPDFTVLDTGGLPDGSRVVELVTARAVVRTTDGHRAQLLVRGRPPDDPLTAGGVDLVAGRLPAAGDEVALTDGAADALAVGVGDRLTLGRPDLDLDVVGVVEDADDLSGHAAVVVDPSAVAGGLARVDVTRMGLVDLPPDADPAAVAAQSQIQVRGEVWGDPAGGRVAWTFVVGALVLTVAGIVIAAAFAAGARRQLTTLGQLSAAGAPGSVLRTMLVLEATLTGLVGALAGTALAAAMLLAGRGRVEVLFNRRLPAYDVRPGLVAAACVFGVAAATLAAAVPARTVTRVPTLTALAGRRPLPAVRRSVVVAGFVAMAGGLGLVGTAVLGSAGGGHGTFWTLVAITGGVLELLGTCAIAPAVAASLEPLAGRTRGAWRLAARSLARQRSRTGAVVSAVAAAAGLAVAAGAMLASAEADEPTIPDLPEDAVVASVVDPGGGGAGLAPAPPDAGTRRELEAILAGAEATPIRFAGTPADWPGRPPPVIADDAVLDALGTAGEVRDLVDDIGLVGFGPVQPPGPTQAGEGRAEVVAGGSGPAVPGGEVTLPDVTLPDGTEHPIAHGGEGVAVGGAHWNLIAPDLAEDLGVELRPGAVAYRTPAPLTGRQLDDLDLLRSEWYQDHPAQPSASLFVEARWNEPDGPTPAQVGLLLAGVALVFSALVVGASLALAAAESRDERDVLSVAGVSPGMLARSAGARAWLLAGLGAAMAVPAGLLPVAVGLAADESTTPFVVPWSTIAVLVVALPLVAAGGAAAASAVTQRVRPVRVSTARFE